MTLRLDPHAQHEIRQYAAALLELARGIVPIAVAAWGGTMPKRRELDHLIPLALGGADEDSNLWPEPRRSIEPEWNAERKGSGSV